MASAISNKIKYLLATKKVDFSADVFKIILMQSGFTFDIDAHHVYADVLANELATAFGYTIGGATLAGITVTEDDTDDRTEITWNNVAWPIAGGDITASGAIIYDDTIAAPTVDAIVGYIDFTANQTVLNGGTFTIANLLITIS